MPKAAQRQALANMPLLERLDLAVLVAQDLEAQVSQLPLQMLDALELRLAADAASAAAAQQFIKQL